jgi:DNA-binding NtrC family response regulator
MSSSKRILVVEDETMILMDIENTLASAGHVVAGASTVAEGQKLLEAGGFDLAVIDFHLRDGTSEGLAGQLADRGVPFILCTGTAHGDELGEIPQRTLLLQKPYTSEALIEAVEKALQ